MIISKTPLRISYVGGATDRPCYYKKHGGAVINVAIDKYIYVTVNSRFDGKIHLRYSKTEEVNCPEELEHSIARECLKEAGINKGVEIVIVSDVPTKGCGLGSSSALTVGLLNALYAFKGCRAKLNTLAEKACKIEIESLKSPIGKQDQYACAYGGFNLFSFIQDGSVLSEDLLVSSNYEKVKWLEEATLLFYLGKGRDTNGILKDYEEGCEMDKVKVLDGIKLLVYDMKTWLQNGVDEHVIGRIVDTGWELKKQMSNKTSDYYIDELYQKTMKAGACGGKVVGAGGGGFLMVIAEPKVQHYVREELKDLKEMKFKFEEYGSRLYYV